MRIEDLISKIEQWGYDRKILTNGKPMAQAIKTLEETTELIEAINRNEKEDIKDAIGDIFVTLLMVCGTVKIDFIDCVDKAYEEIKDRKGYLREDGVFIKTE